jgi:hypothetical protein
VVSQFAKQRLRFDGETLSGGVPGNTTHVSSDQWSAQRALQPSNENLLPIGKGRFAHIGMRWPQRSVPTAASATGGALAATAVAEGDGTILARFGLVHGQFATAVLLFVERCDCRLGFEFVFHFDKPKTLAAAGISIINDLRAIHDSVCGEQLLQFRAVHFVAQISDVEFFAHKFAFDVSWPTVQIIFRGRKKELHSSPKWAADGERLRAEFKLFRFPVICWISNMAIAAFPIPFASAAHVEL